MRAHLRLVHSSGEAPMKRKRAKERVYPQSATCFRCTKRFTGDDAKQIVENDGACDPCAEILDTFPMRSEQGNPDNSAHEWKEPSKC